MGIDGVYRHRRSQSRPLDLYQVKFRKGRPVLSWTEVGTFFGAAGLADSPQIDQRALFTNCNEISPFLAGRERVFCILGYHLDELDADDFEAMHNWLVGTAVEKKPHQQKASGALVSGFELENRASCIMACATGKTLVGLRLVEQWVKREGC